MRNTGSWGWGQLCAPQRGTGVEHNLAALMMLSVSSACTWVSVRCTFNLPGFSGGKNHLAVCQYLLNQNVHLIPAALILSLYPNKIQIYFSKGMYKYVCSGVNSSNSQKLETIQCPLSVEWKRKLWYAHPMDHYAAVRMNTATWINQTTLSKTNQTYILHNSFMYKIQTLTCNIRNQIISILWREVTEKEQMEPSGILIRFYFFICIQVT